MHPDSNSSPDPTSPDPHEPSSDARGDTEPASLSLWRELERDAGVGNGPEAVLNAILNAAFRLFPVATSGAVYLLRAGRLKRRVSLWSDGRAEGPAGSLAAESIAHKVAGSGQPEMADLLSPDQAAVALAELPLKSGGRLVAVITLTFGDRREFSGVRLAAAGGVGASRW